MSTSVDPLVVDVVRDIAAALRALEVDFCIIGALAAELLLDVPPRHFTNDADLTVTVDSLATFDQLKERLRGFGFAPARSRPYRLTRRAGGWVDLLPYSASWPPTGGFVSACEIG